LSSVCTSAPLLCCFSSCVPPLRAPRSSLFPYTTLFRSIAAGEPFELGFGVDDGLRVRRHTEDKRDTTPVIGTQKLLRTVRLYIRSEEHTSELQSHLNLVCRLLLEKKKHTPKSPQHTTAT